MSRRGSCAAGSRPGRSWSGRAPGRRTRRKVSQRIILKARSLRSSGSSLRRDRPRRSMVVPLALWPGPGRGPDGRRRRAKRARRGT
jgi:hypothetical protein